LQRNAGNAAVTSLIASQQPDEVTAQGSAANGPIALYWLPDRSTRETFVVTHSSTTVAALASYLYGNDGAAVDLAAINGLGSAATLNVGAYLKVAPLGGHKPTTAAAKSFKESPWFTPGTRDPAVAMAAMGITHPAQFAAAKQQRDAALERDFVTIVRKLDESHYSHADEDLVLEILRQWGSERLTNQPSRYPNGGEYLDRLFQMLRRKTKDVGVLTEQSSNYYNLMFNHFDRVAELKTIRDTYSKAYRGDSGTKEDSFGGFFWEEVKSGAVRDQIFAYAKGVAKGVWSGAKGTVQFAITLATNPKKAWQQIKDMPGAVKNLWRNRRALWKKFVNASPEEQAEMIGRLVGEAEFAIASGGAGTAITKGASSVGVRFLGRLAQAPGPLGRLGAFTQAAAGAASRMVGRVGQWLTSARAAAGSAVRSVTEGLRAAVRTATAPLRMLASRVGARFRSRRSISVYHGTDQSALGRLGALGEGKISVTAGGRGAAQDIGRGFYLTDDALTAALYASRRGAQRSRSLQHVLRFDVPTKTFGDIVDIRLGGNYKRQWERFLDEPPGLPADLTRREGFRTNREYLMGYGVEQRGDVFERFLQKINKDPDAVFAPVGSGVFTGIATGGRSVTQICIRSQRVADRLNAIIRGKGVP
jgi:hypothetical protein